MQVIGKQRIWAFFDDDTRARTASNSKIRRAPAYRVRSYLELAKKVAELQFRNPDYVLLFRGQSRDFRHEGQTTLKASLFRSSSSGIPNSSALRDRFETLKRAEEALVRFYKNQAYLGWEPLWRHRILRWSILQHYEVCATPLLDVTHSLRIAASFASGEGQRGFVYILAVPNLSGAVTASAEAGLQIVRLSSVCPPVAVRPHIQEGYLLGQYPEVAAVEEKSLRPHYEIDFARRLIGKFEFDPRKFWKSDTFPKVSQMALYPPAELDPLYKLALRVKEANE
jgi:FRG domain-containing protein